MRLVFDDTEVTLVVATLEEVLQEVALLTSLANANGRVVACTMVDDQEVADLEAFLQARVYPPPEVIKITTLTPAALVSEVITTALTFLPALHAEVLEKASLITRGDTTSSTSWSKIFESLDWLNSLLAGVLQHYHLTAAKKQEAVLIAEDLRQSLREMAAAWEQGDVVGLADVLEYRLAQLIEECLAFFTALRSEGERR